ncbi:MAG TPA: hypothetical protein VGZ93_06665 [Candidatus Methylacidiphilales bacterium]|jgi:hypothetical protein|nr:hypothetical protein [Candidatus Methylacidiphilales bacterium]
MKSAYYRPALLILTTLLVAGCGGVALHNDEINYADTGAYDANEQLLNNLARYSCYDPPYFLQLGQITALHTYQGSAGLAQDAQSHNHYGATAGLMTTEQPSFQFVPITGTSFMNAISAPITPKLFLTFYSQGYPADVLARVLIQSVIFVVQVKDPKTGKDKIRAYVARNDPTDPTYPDFLIFCLRLRSEQMADIKWVWKSPDRSLKLNNVTPVDAINALNAGYQLKNAPPVANSTNGLSSSAVSGSSDVTSASKQSPNNGNSVELSTPGESGLFVTGQEYEGLGDYQITDEQNDVLHHLPILSLAAKKALGTKNAKNDFFVSFPGTPSKVYFNGSHEQISDSVEDIFQMRTFVEVLRATAQEKAEFSERFGPNASGNTMIKPYQGSNDLWSLIPDNGPIKGPYLVQPILRLNREDLSDLLSAKHRQVMNSSYSILASVHYDSKDYVLGDLMDENGVPVVNALRNNDKNDRLDSLLTSNKQVFLLISELYADISIDPKNLPVQQFIQTQ